MKNNHMTNMTHGKLNIRKNNIRNNIIIFNNNTFLGQIQMVPAHITQRQQAVSVL